MKKSQLRHIIKESIRELMTEQAGGISYFQSQYIQYGGNNLFNCIKRSGPTEDSYCCNGSANNNPDPANYADKPLGWYNLSIVYSGPYNISLSNWRSTECHPCPGGNNLSNFRDWMAGIGTTYSSNIGSSNIGFLNAWGEGDPYGVGDGWNPTLPNSFPSCQSYNSSNPCTSNCDNCWFGYFTTKQACEDAGMNGDWSGFGGMAYTTGTNSSNPLYGCLDPLATNFMAQGQYFGILSDPSLCEYELYRCGHCNTPCTAFIIQNNPGLCVYDNPTVCAQGCDAQTADIERWTCMGPDKFGNPQQGCRQCTQYEIDNAAMNSFSQTNGTPYGCHATGGHATQQDCENHSTTINNSVFYGCALSPYIKTEPGLTKTPQEPNINPVSPVKSDSQSKMIDPEIDRMQDLANIKKEK